MRNSSRRRYLSVLLCVLLVALAFLSMFIAGAHAFHKHAVDRCDICAIIHSKWSLRKLLSFVAVHSLIVLTALMIGHGFWVRLLRQRQSVTLISLKIRLNP